MIRKQYGSSRYGQLHFRESHPTRQTKPPTIIYLHQTASSSVMFEKVMLNLRSKWYQVAPDTPGFGQSSLLDKIPTVNTYANAIWAGLEKIIKTRVVLFGHHTGAAIAVAMARLQPSLVDGLILCGPPLLSAETKQTLRDKLPSLEFDQTGSYLNTIWQHISAKDTNLPQHIIYRETLSTLQAWQEPAHAYEAVFTYDFAEEVAKITCPILVFSGEHDSLADSVEPTYQLLQNGHRGTIPQAGSFVCDTHSKDVSTLVDNFMQLISNT